MEGGCGEALQPVQVVPLGGSGHPEIEEFEDHDPVKATVEHWHQLGHDRLVEGSDR